MSQDISFDPAKSHRNEVERGLPFSLVLDLEWASALIKEDTRRDYGERRFQVLGLIHGRLHAMVFTPRDDKVHVISLRKANNREVNHHEQTQNPTTRTRH
jgi:uncharacterized DUF497 family protein